MTMNKFAICFIANFQFHAMIICAGIIAYNEKEKFARFKEYVNKKNLYSFLILPYF